MSHEDHRGLEALARAHIAEPGVESLGALCRWLESFDVARLDPFGWARSSRVDTNTWYTTSLVTTPNAAVKLFELPAEASIPPHDHPAMTVLMRIVHGRGRIVAGDWVDESLARMSFDQHVEPGDSILVTEPTRHNLHTIEAVSDFAFVDLMIPPYNPEQGRPCRTYTAEQSDDPALWRLHHQASYS